MKVHPIGAEAILSDNASWFGVGFHSNRCAEQTAENNVSQEGKKSELRIEVLFLRPSFLSGVESELQVDYFLRSQQKIKLASS